MEFPQKINFGSFDDWRFNQQQEQKYTIGHNILELYRAEPRKNAPADNENLMIAMKIVVQRGLLHNIYIVLIIESYSDKNSSSIQFFMKYERGYACLTENQQVLKSVS